MSMSFYFVRFIYSQINAIFRAWKKKGNPSGISLMYTWGGGCSAPSLINLCPRRDPELPVVVPRGQLEWQMHIVESSVIGFGIIILPDEGFSNFKFVKESLIFVEISLFSSIYIIDSYRFCRYKPKYMTVLEQNDFFLRACDI